MSRATADLPIRLLAIGLLGVGLLPALPSQRPALAAPPGNVRAFVQQHCVECHGEKSQKGNLRLDTLATDFAVKETRERWNAVLERVRAGEMPPAKKPRPAKDDVAAVAAWIETELAAVDATRRAKEGRTVLRRLNRTEYNHTLRDLLSIDVDLTELLPEDAAMQGFDNVDAALAISPVLLERYLAAADAALDAAIVKGQRPETTKRRINFKEVKGIAAKIAEGTFIGQTGDAAILYHHGYTPYELRELWNSKPGRYRFRISAYGHNTDRPALMRVYVGNFIPNQGQSHLAGFFEVAPNKPTVIEFIDRLEVMHDTVKPVPYDTGNPWRE